MPSKGAKPTPKGKPRAPVGTPCAPSRMPQIILPERPKAKKIPIHDYDVVGPGLVETEVEVTGKRKRFAPGERAVPTSNSPTDAKNFGPEGHTCDECGCADTKYWCNYLSLSKILCMACGNYRKKYGVARPGPCNAIHSIHPPPITSIDDIVLPHNLSKELCDTAFEQILSDTALEKIRQDHNSAVVRRTDCDEVRRMPEVWGFLENVEKTLRIRNYVWKLLNLSNEGDEEGEKKGEDVEMVDAPSTKVQATGSNGAEHNNAAQDDSIPLEPDTKDQLTFIEVEELYKILASQWCKCSGDHRARWDLIDNWADAAKRMNDKFEGSDHAIAAGVALAPRLPNTDGTRQYTTLPTARPFGIKRVTGWRLMALANQLKGPIQKIKSMYEELGKLDEVEIPANIFHACLDDKNKLNDLAVAALGYQIADQDK